MILRPKKTFFSRLYNADIRNPNSGYQEPEFGVSGTKVIYFTFIIKVLRKIKMT